MFWEKGSHKKGSKNELFGENKGTKTFSRANKKGKRTLLGGKKGAKKEKEKYFFEKITVLGKGRKGINRKNCFEKISGLRLFREQIRRGVVSFGRTRGGEKGEKDQFEENTGDENFSEIKRQRKILREEKGS